VYVTAAELVEGHRLARDHADHLRTRDEHVPLSRDDEDEVGDRRRVDGATGARARDDADLRDHAGRANVAVEDVRVAGERDHSFLDPSTTRVVDADDRYAVAQRELLHLDDLLGGDLTERAAEDRCVIRVDGDRAAVDVAEPCDHTVAGDAAVLHVETVRAMRGEHIELHERAVVYEHLDALPGGRLAGGSPLVGGFRLSVKRLVAPLPILVDLLFRDAGRLALGRFDALQVGKRPAHGSE